MQNANPVPSSLLTKLNNFTVDNDTFLALDKAKERVGGRYLYLEDGKIRLDTYTQPPHAEVIGEILRQSDKRLWRKGLATAAKQWP